MIGSLVLCMACQLLLDNLMSNVFFSELISTVFANGPGD